MKQDLKPAVYICRKTHRTVLSSPDPSARYPKGSELPLPCSFESSDATEFEQHMKVVHSGGRRTKMSKVPKLKPEGYAPRQTKPFEPTGLEVGATVTWKELVPTGETRTSGDYGGEHQVPVTEWVMRSGQVWSLAYNGVWVIPFEPFECELAVMVRKDKWDPEARHVQTQRRMRTAA